MSIFTPGILIKRKRTDAENDALGIQREDTAKRSNNNSATATLSPIGRLVEAMIKFLKTERQMLDMGEIGHGIEDYDESKVQELERWIIENKNSDFIVDVNGGGSSSSSGGGNDNKIRVAFSEDGRDVEQVGFTGDVEEFTRIFGCLSTKERFYNLLKDIGGNVSIDDVRRIDRDLFDLLQRSKNRIQAELVDSGRVTRVSPGVFRV